ncbi:MAG: hypothetical protein OWQ54_05005 [Sulfolobaceae archaeon]|nr:hypothetical protein [Sulfolobaceae archaeon]
MERKYIEIFGLKGGSGKSFVTYFLSRELSRYKKILIVDRGYSPTIAKLYGIDNNLTSYLLGKSDKPFTKSDGNITILNVSCNDEFNKLENKKVVEAYSNVIKNDGYDIVLVDNPNFKDYCYDKHREVWKTFVDEDTIKAIAVTSPPLFVIKATKDALKNAMKLFSMRFIAIVINKDTPQPIASEGLEDIAPVFRVSFNKEFMFSSWKILQTPNEIVKLAKFVIENN